MRAWILLAAALPAAAASFDHAALEHLLSSRVNEIGEVDYEAIRKDPGDLQAYLAQVAETSPDNRPEMFSSRAERLAYWINVYNALTIHGVVENLPLRSIKDVPEFFEQRRYSVGGRKLSLRDVEHRIIRKRFAEPRIHFAIVCASLSCPELASFAYAPERLEEQLERRARRFVNQPRYVRADRNRGVVLASKIFEWYGDDFDEGVLEFIRSRADAKLAAQIDSLPGHKIKYASYDWSLNGIGSRARARGAAR